MYLTSFYSGDCPESYIMRWYPNEKDMKRLSGASNILDQHLQHLRCETDKPDLPDVVRECKCAATRASTRRELT